MKKSLEIKEYHQQLEVGDRVRVIDGSSLTVKENGIYDPQLEECIIICAYPELTGSSNRLKDIVGTVVEINITDRIVPGEATLIAYRQDIVIQLHKAFFRTASRMVRKI